MIKNILFFLVGVPSFIFSCYSLYDYILETHFHELDIKIEHFLMGENQEFTYTKNNIFGRKNSNNKEEKENYTDPSMKLSFIAFNEKNESVTINNISLTVTLKDQKKDIIFVNYFIHEKNINQDQKFNSVFLIEGKTIKKISVDFIYDKAISDIFLKECPSKIRLSLNTDKNKFYNITESFIGSNCRYSHFISYPGIDKKSDNKTIIYGRDFLHPYYSD